MKSLTLNTLVGSLSANLYLPEGIENPPVVIVTGAWTTVKEQMPATYARALVEKGFAALTFDFRGWGQSPDAIRYLEDPSRKTDDIRAVIDAVAQLDSIDSKRIFGLGICASAGYMLNAVSSNSKVTATAAVAPWLHDRELANTVYGGAESVDGLISMGEDAERAIQPVYIEAASNTNENSLMYQAPYYNESDRGKIPEYDNQFNVASWKGWLTYDALIGAPTQDKPVLLVASEAMALPQGAKDYVSKSGNNVQIVWLDNVTQFDFYDVPQQVSAAADTVAEHFAKFL